MRWRKYIDFDVIHLLVGAIVGVGLSSCQPEMPVISTITVEADGLTVPVNPDLYGLTIEEINHGIDGGLYAELIQNRSFEDGVPPLNCPYDAARNVLITPNGWTIPFMRGDSVPGWRRIVPNTQIYPDMKELVNDKNRRSLLVAVSTSGESGRGGVIAEGYRGIPIRKGERYDLSFFAKGANMVPRTIRVALEDSMANTVLSDVFQVAPPYEWRRYRHTFTATEDAPNAVLTITADTSAVFWLDVVSLFPEDTWKGRKNGLRPDLAALVDSLAPRFIRFPGGSFVEGYTAGTYLSGGRRWAISRSVSISGTYGPMVRRTAWATTSTCKCARIWGRSLSTLLIAGSRAKAAGPATRISRRWISSREMPWTLSPTRTPRRIPCRAPACEERASGTFQLEVCRDRQRELWWGVFQAL